MYLVTRINANEAAVTAGTRFGLVRFRECGKLLFGKRQVRKDSIKELCKDQNFD